MAKIQALGSSAFEVELFDGKKNFNLWQSTVKDILVQQGLVRTLNGKEKKPDNMTDEEWEEMEMKAVSMIRLCLAPEVKYSVLDETSAVKLWKKLENIYMPKSMTNRRFLKKELYQLKMDDGVDIRDHLNYFTNLITQLSSIGVKVEEEDKALLLLSSLPHSYEDLIITLLVGAETLKLDDVIAVLLGNEKFKKPSVQSEGARFVARSDRRANRGKSVSRGNNSDRENSRSKGKESLGDSEPEVSNGLQGPTPKRCTHCLAEKTPQWRPGPLGPKTLCNACGMRFKTGKLLPEYRPANSPTFVSDLHSNSHREVMEMRMAPQSSIPSEQ